MKFVIDKVFQPETQETFMFLSSYCTGADGNDLALFHKQILGGYKDTEIANKCACDLEQLLKASDPIKNTVIICETVDASNKDMEE